MDKEDKNIYKLYSNFTNEMKKIYSTPMEKIAYLLEKWLFWANLNEVIVENVDALKSSDTPSTLYLSAHWSHLDSPAVHAAFRQYGIQDPEILWGDNLKLLYPILTQHGYMIKREHTIKELNHEIEFFSDLLIKGHRLLMYPGISPKTGRSWSGVHQEFSDFPAICMDNACEYGVNAKVSLFHPNYDPYTPEERILSSKLRSDKKILKDFLQLIEWGLIMVRIIGKRPNVHVKFDNPVSFAELVEISKSLPDEFASLFYKEQYPILKNKEKDFEEIREKYNSKSDEEKSEFFKEIRKYYISLPEIGKISLRQKITSYLTYRERKLFMPNKRDILCASIYETKEKMLQLSKTLKESGYDTSLTGDVSDVIEQLNSIGINKTLIEYHANRVLSLSY